MQRAIVLGILAGCGRLGFEPYATGTLDATPDTTLAGRCSATPVTGFDYGFTGIVDLGAAAVPDGFAIGGVRAPSSSVWGIHLSTALVPDRGAPFETTPVGGNGTYVGVNLYWDGANLDGVDLREAIGLSAAQVCSAANGRRAILAPEFQLEVETLCGTPRLSVGPAIQPPR